MRFRLFFQSHIEFLSGLLLLLVLAWFVPFKGNVTGDGNLMVLQADAFLRGTTAISNAQLDDVALFEGRAYLPFPPAPAVLALPLVAVVGTAAPSTALISLALTILSFLAIKTLTRRLGLSRSDHLFLCAAYFSGLKSEADTQRRLLWRAFIVYAVLLNVFALFGLGTFNRVNHWWIGLF